MITIKDIHYYPGFRIARLYNTSCISELTAREKQTLDEALKIVDCCREPGQDPLMLEKKLHDAICDRLTDRGRRLLLTFNIICEYVALCPAFGLYPAP